MEPDALVAELALQHGYVYTFDGDDSFGGQKVTGAGCRQDQRPRTSSSWPRPPTPN
jgi:hypothetical protein